MDLISKARSKVLRLLDATEGIVAQLKRAAVLTGATRDRSLSEALTLGALSRLLNLLKGVRALEASQLPAEIGALARIIAEAVILLTWVMGLESDAPGDRDSRAKKLFDHATLKGELVRKRHELYGKPLRDPEKTELLQHVAEIKNDWNLQGDSPGAIETSLETASKAGTGKTSKFYEVVYRPLCWDAHADMRSFIDAHKGYEPIAVVDRTARAIECALNLLSVCGLLLSNHERDAEIDSIRAALKDMSLLSMER
jgi:hypothetical protein